jgi:hypothetical protein
MDPDKDSIRLRPGLSPCIAFSSDCNLIPELLGFTRVTPHDPLLSAPVLRWAAARARRGPSSSRATPPHFPGAIPLGRSGRSSLAPHRARREEVVRGTQNQRPLHCRESEIREQRKGYNYFPQR